MTPQPPFEQVTSTVAPGVSAAVPVNGDSLVIISHNFTPRFEYWAAFVNGALNMQCSTAPTVVFTRIRVLEGLVIRHQFPEVQTRLPLSAAAPDLVIPASCIQMLPGQADGIIGAPTGVPQPSGVPDPPRALATLTLELVIRQAAATPNVIVSNQSTLELGAMFF